MPKRNTKCPHCGAKMVEYKHGLNRGLLTGLRAIAKAGWGGKTVKLRTLELNNSEWDNFQKLQYWDLVSKVGSKKSGNWKITELGQQFVSGEKPVNHYVWTYRGVRQRYEGPPLFIDNVLSGYKYRPQYAAEATSTSRAPEVKKPEQMELL